MLQQVRFHTNRGSLHLEQGFYEEAIAETDIALRLAALAGFTSFRALALANRGSAYYHLGRIEEAVSDEEESRRLYERLGSRERPSAVPPRAGLQRPRGPPAGQNGARTCHWPVGGDSGSSSIGARVSRARPGARGR